MRYGTIGLRVVGASAIGDTLTITVKPADPLARPDERWDIVIRGGAPDRAAFLATEVLTINGPVGELLDAGRGGE